MLSLKRVKFLWEGRTPELFVKFSKFFFTLPPWINHKTVLRFCLLWEHAEKKIPSALTFKNGKKNCMFTGLKYKISKLTGDKIRTTFSPSWRSICLTGYEVPQVAPPPLHNKLIFVFLAPINLFDNED